MTLDDYLRQQDFEILQRTRDGANRYVRRANRFLRFWVTWFTDGMIEFTWEFELGAYLIEKGFSISVQDELSLLLFPAAEVRGPADAQWLAEQILIAEARFESVDLLAGT
jgi:hypothetical protein